ncbi:MAG: FAD-dependent oxidoreductase [Acidimicrobiia bacterium]|nr:FAD-dependent oxidoreductase [Acidimicrobiia bacterium]
MTRDVARLSVGTYDLLVIGGGIYGLIIAADAAMRGLSVALVERDDFGSGNSFNHLRTIHGGLRYLQHLDLARARESIAERRTLAQIAPHFVRPLPFVLPLTSLLRGPWVMRAGFLVDAIVARHRNAGLPTSHHLPAGRVLDANDASRQIPEVRGGRHPAAVWYDYVVTEADRLTLAWALLAAEHGATLVNHATATTLLLDGRRVAGAQVVDSTDGRTWDVAARVTVNATGADIDRLLAPVRLPTATPMIRAMNLVTSLDAGASAVGATTGGRALFLVPWRGRALCGTWESSRTVQPEAVMPADWEADVSGFLQAITAAFPRAGVTRQHVTLVHRGVVPARVDSQGRVTLEGRQRLHDHAVGSTSLAGLISVAGTKYTTARATAEAAVNLVIAKLGGRAASPCRTSTESLPTMSRHAVGRAGTDGRTAPTAPGRRGPAPDVLAELVAVFGSEHLAVLSACAERPDLAHRLSDTAPVIGAQIVWAVRHEMAVTLADVILRRTSLGALGHPGTTALSRAAAVMASELQWDSARVAREIAGVEGFYKSRSAR